MQRIAAKNRNATRCENETDGATLRFLDDRPKKAKGGRLRSGDGGGGGRETERLRWENKKKKSKRKSFPLVERNTHRFATIQRFPRASARALCNAPLLLLNRALDRCGRTIKIASPRDLSKVRARAPVRAIHFSCVFSLPRATRLESPRNIDSEEHSLARPYIGIPLCNNSRMFNGFYCFSMDVVL